MSVRRRGRDINGILLLDKPLGISSNQALTKVKHWFDAKKVGHTGSLDPLATGMLPICFGEATKFSQYLLEADKQYLVDARLGERTLTGDAEGEVIERREVNVSQNLLNEAINSFRGEIEQIPSMFSAIKHQGKPLYYYARQGIEIERQPRKVNIKELTLLDLKENTASFRVTCSKGTYIRTLIEDIGEKLGCGAFVSALRRTYVEPYVDKKMVTSEELKEALQDNKQLDDYLFSIDSALSAWPTLTLTQSIAFYIRQGQPVLIPHAPTQGLVRLMTESGQFFGVGEILVDGRVAPRRLAVGAS
jgi:tRNA pseudouridine55 synthase